jgi:hypothetical protein
MNTFPDLEFLGSFLAQALILQADKSRSTDLLGLDFNAPQGSSLELSFEPNGLAQTQ